MLMLKDLLLYAIIYIPFVRDVSLAFLKMEVFLEGEGWELDIGDYSDICKWTEQEGISRDAIATLLWCVSNDYLKLDPEFWQDGSERFLNYGLARDQFLFQAGLIFFRHISFEILIGFFKDYGLEIARVNYKCEMFGLLSIEIRYPVRILPNMLLVEYDGRERMVFIKTILPGCFSF